MLADTTYANRITLAVLSAMMTIRFWIKSKDDDGMDWGTALCAMSFIANIVQAALHYLMD